MATTSRDWQRRSADAKSAHGRSSTESSGRSEARRDHDRVFYSAEFERLEEVTQIATLTSSSVRNRLTHSYRVEQIAHSIASRNPGFDIDLEVVTTAALVHDMGHAPFGHTGEEALQRAVSCKTHRSQPYPDIKSRLDDVPKTLKGEKRRDTCDPDRPCLLFDGFEGNAQTFRILTLLGSNHPSTPSLGLDLTRRTLRASLKYPWLAKEKPTKLGKWGVYDLDLPAFQWVLEVDDVDSILGYRPQDLEASVMDIADDIAYAVHDLEDAYKLGLIPMSELSISRRSPTLAKIVNYIRAEAEGGAGAPLSASPVMKIVEEYDDFATSTDAISSSNFPHLNQLESCLNSISVHRYSGGFQSRGELSKWRAGLISLFVNSVEIKDGQAKFETEQIESSIEFLKQLTWYFVIDDPDLTAIREGQENLVISCFDRLFELASEAWLTSPADDESAKWREEPLHRLSKRLPERLTDYVWLTKSQMATAGLELCTPRQGVARAVVDYICSLTDAEVYSYSLQLDGSPAHSVPGAFRR